VTDIQDHAEQQPSTPQFDLTGLPETTRDLQQTADWFGSPDGQLQRMSQWVNQMEQGIGITLVVAGGAISGTLISAREFYASSSTHFQESVDENGDEKQSKAAADYAEFFFDEPAKFSAEQVEKNNTAFKEGKLTEPPYMMVRYLHLKDARYSVPGQSHLPLGYTRVLLSQVAAWSVGQTWASSRDA